MSDEEDDQRDFMSVDTALLHAIDEALCVLSEMGEGSVPIGFDGEIQAIVTAAEGCTHEYLREFGRRLAPAVHAATVFAEAMAELHDVNTHTVELLIRTSREHVMKRSMQRASEAAAVKKMRTVTGAAAEAVKKMRAEG